MYVYKTTNLINNKIYIGISKKTSIESTRYLGSGKAFKRAITKYGRGNFIKEIIIEDEDFTYKDLQRLEVFLIDIFDSRNPLIGYNISIGGDGNVGETNGMYHKNHTQETKDKISNTRFEKLQENPLYGKLDEEAKLKRSSFMSERNKISPTLPNGHSNETKNKISATILEKFKNGEIQRNYVPFTEERKEEYSVRFSGEDNPMFGKKHTQEAIDKLKESIRVRFPPVNKIDQEGNTIKEYESITDVTVDGYRPDLVKKVLKGENKLHGGFYWKLV